MNDYPTTADLLKDTPEDELRAVADSLEVLIWKLLEEKNRNLLLIKLLQGVKLDAQKEVLCRSFPREDVAAIWNLKTTN